MPFQTALILKIDHKQDPLNTAVNWLNENFQLSLDQSSIVNQPNITLVNQAGESIKIEEIRQIKEQLSYGAYQHSQLRFFIFLYAHNTTIPAQNALLKTIEEPPKNTQLIFITPYPEKLLDTVKSRCTLVIAPENLSTKTITTDVIRDEYFKITTSNPGQKITLAGLYKEREAALILCQELLAFLHSELTNQTNVLTLKQVTHNSFRILETIAQLEKNGNVSLALENCFFELL